MKFIICVFSLMIVSVANAGSTQKLEGQCRGQMDDGSQVNFTYYSNYNGCPGKIAGSIKFSSESGLGSHKGIRSFENQKDVYSFKAGRLQNRQEKYRLTFEDSTGNISGLLDYFDTQGNKQSINVQCIIRDFHYEDCSLPI